MSLSSPRELFVHELADMMSAESIIAGMLPELASEVQHPELAAAFKNHEKETKAQVCHSGDPDPRLATTCWLSRT